MTRRRRSSNFLAQLRVASWLFALSLQLSHGLGQTYADVAPRLPGPDQHFSMPETLQRIAAQASPDENFFLNAERAKRLEAELVRTQDFQRKIQLGFAFAQELLYAGQTQAAIDVLIQMRKVFASLGGRASAQQQKRVGELLAVAYLRQGEQENCLEHHHARSCLFPIDERGRHHLPQGSRNAMRELVALLKSEPDLRHQWLLNLAAMTVGEYPDGVPEIWRLDVNYPDAGPLQPFEDQAIAFDVAGNGLSGGSIMEDFNGDGYLDLMTSSWGLGDSLRYWRNNGDGTFSDISLVAGLGGLGGGLNLTHADYDNDGYPDVLVLRGAWLGPAGRHPNSLLRNQGDGTFVDVTRDAGLLSFHPTQTAAWADADGDGWLDLFVGTESGQRERSPSQFYRNNGDGTFTEIGVEAGLDAFGFIKGATWGDFDNDGRPDLYVSRFAQSNLLFRNETRKVQGRTVWNFVEVSRTAGVEDPLQSFATWFWDFDNDGWEDLMVAPFAGLSADSLKDVVDDLLERPSAGAKPRLYRNRGNGTFADVTSEMNLDKVLVAMGANFGDLDNDGFLDAYFGTGEPSLSTLIPNRMFRNLAGESFADVTEAGGFGHLQKGHGISFGDFDNDGDQDIYAVLGGAYSGDVYANALFVNPGTDNHSVTLRFEGRQSNRFAQGARLRILTQGPSGQQTLYRTVGTGGSFGSSSLQLEIGLGKATRLEQIEVRWPGQASSTQIFEGLDVGGVYLLREGDPAPVELESRSFSS